MTRYARYNLMAMMSLPVIAALASIAMFGFRLDTILFVFGTNLGPMLIGGLISGLLLRFATMPGTKSRFVAIWPTLVPAIFGIVWYVAGVVLDNPVDPGREYMAVPLYLLMWIVPVSVVALIGCLMTR